MKNRNQELKNPHPNREYECRYKHEKLVGFKIDQNKKPKPYFVIAIQDTVMCVAVKYS
jgi:hypothetical protein